MTTLSPHRIPDWRLHLAIVTDFLSPGPDHEGATTDWIQELREAFTDRPAVSRPTDVPTAVIPTVRRPIAALTATGHYAIYDEHLGGLNPGPLEPARIHDELIGGTR